MPRAAGAYAAPGAPESEVEEGSASSAPPAPSKPPAHGRVGTLLAFLAATLAVAAVLSVTGVPRAVRPALSAIGLAVSAADASCAPTGGDCRASRCCADGGLHCYAKSADWATCMPACKPGAHADDVDQFPWSCELLLTDQAAAACSAWGSDCQSTRCCKISGLQCFAKNSGWAACEPDCVPGPRAGDADKAPWSCQVLQPLAPGEKGRTQVQQPAAAYQEPAASTPVMPAPPACADNFGDCSFSKCCNDGASSCFEKNAKWASCMPQCTPGVQKGDPDPTPWSCAKLWSPAMVKQNWASAEARAWATVSQMEDYAKMTFIMGAAGGNGYAGFINPQYALEGSQALTMNDGPQGYNAYQERLKGSSTQFPALISVAASFDQETSRRYAQAVAEEFVAKGCNVMLGPDVEVTRAVLTGRSFETISGEDPFLGSQLVQPFIRAVQDQGIVAVVKHWLDNNQEIYRQTMNVEVGDRAQHEIYMPVFKAAFDAGAAGVMCSYNSVYGEHACQNPKLLKTLLRQELGFKGFVVSDWGATHDTVASVKSGLDIEMPGGQFMNQIPDLIAGGMDLKADVDQMVVHVLSAMYFVGQFDGKFPVQGQLPKPGALDTDATNDWHRQVALLTIVESAVLLKNEGHTLPIATKGKTIAMIGKYCNATVEPSYKQGSVWSGGGSGFVDTARGTTPLDGVRQHIKDAKAIRFSADASAAEGADVAVLCLAAHGEEGWDRADLILPEAEDLIRAVRKRNPRGKLVVLAAVPGAVCSEWVEDVDAALLMFMPGEQVGPAVAQLLTGEASPSGRLPISFPKKDEQRFSQFQYPGTCPGKNKWCENMTAHFTEGVLVGYRWNDAMGVPSAYPFGFGLSYTAFEFSGFKATCSKGRATVGFEVKNVGGRQGAAVPQLYVAFPSLKPVVRQLRGFRKVQLDAGTNAHVEFQLGLEEWQYYDEPQEMWQSALEKGEEVTVSIGVSSAELKWTGVLPCGQTTTVIVKKAKKM